VKAIILAAGYATRLYPLTKDFPKPLLEVGGRTILDHLVAHFAGIPELDGAVLVTNHRFAGHFQAWRDRQSLRLPFEILDDNTSSNDDRLGGVGDLLFAVERTPVDDDALVLAADNILRFPLADFVAAWRARPAAHICVRDNPDVEDRKRRGNAVLDEARRVVEFIEKPAQPKSRWSVPPFYIYPRAVLPLVGRFLDEGGTADAPGHLVEWLHTRVPIYAFEVTGDILDIGNPQSLAEARRSFGEACHPEPQSRGAGLDSRSA
jgi:glucose-1-phosphate thymidylyltransferase